jgi:hypothetical protein
MNFLFLIIIPCWSFLLRCKLFWGYRWITFLSDRLRRLIIIFKICFSIWIPCRSWIFITFQESRYFNFWLLKLLIHLTLFFMSNIFLSLCKFSIARSKNFGIKCFLLRNLHVLLLGCAINIIIIILMMNRGTTIVILSHSLFWFSNQSRLFSFFTNHFSSF